MHKLLYIVIGFMVCACHTSPKYKSEKNILPEHLHDNHVHIMSPELIRLWKDMGIPFSKEDSYYKDIDTILSSNKATSVSLISMAYVFSSEEFGGTLENTREKVQNENNYLASVKLKYPNKIRAYYGIDPLQEFALAEVKRCHTELKLDGIKLHHNASQVYLTVPEHLKKVKAIFEYASNNQIPILMHFDNSHPKFGKKDVKILADSILTGLNYVNLQIAHFGTSGGFNQKTKETLDAFIELFQTNHPISKHSITFDISAVGLDKDTEGISKLTSNDFDELAKYSRKLGFDRIVFGTDYPLYRSDEYLNLLFMKMKLTEDEVTNLLRNKNTL